MVYNGINIERREKFTPGATWKLCGEDYGYGLFKSKSPRDYAVFLVHIVFTDEQIKTKAFIYVPHVYRGRQSLMDTIEIYCKETYIPVA
jgi:hypothetical protein